MDSESEQKPCRILMMPWLAHGHLSPFLELAKKLTLRNFQVYFCSTAVNLNPIRQNLNHNNQNSIQFIEIHLPSTPEELPPDYHTTRNLPPHLMPVLKTAFDRSTDSFREIIRAIKPDLVIYDMVQPWAPVIANQENVKAVAFMTFGAAATAFFFHYILNFDDDEDKDHHHYPFPEFRFPQRKTLQITQFLDNVSNGLKDKDRFLQCVKKSSFVLVKSLNDMENQYADYFSSLVGREVIPVGPLVQDPEIKLNDSGIFVEQWLNKRANSSAVFVSFGTEYFLSKDEIEAIALGLELSNVSFLWLIRFSGGENLSLDQVLPKEFQMRLEERGLIVQEWASQAKILNHPSIAGFVSHCGMSSTMESIKFGVPIIAMPTQYDQHLNARLVVNIGVGVEVQREKDDVFKKEDIARAIREVVFLEKGREVREKVKELSAMVMEKGDQEVDHVAKKLLQLVNME